MRKRIPAVVVSVLFWIVLSSCGFSMYKQELSMFRYPFEEYFRYTLTQEDFQQGRGNVEILPDTGVPGNMLILQYDGNTEDYNTYSNYRLLYWTGQQLKDVVLPVNPSLWTFSLGTPGRFVTVTWDDTIPAYVAVVFELVERTESMEVVDLGSRTIDEADFPSVPAGERPENFLYTGGRLYFMFTNGQAMLEVSYAADETGVYDPRETYTSFLQKTDIISDYFDPVSTGITFWTDATFDVLDYRYVPGPDVSMYMVQRRLDLTGESIRFILTYDGSATNGYRVPDTFTRGAFTTFGYTVGERWADPSMERDEVVSFLDPALVETTSLEFYSNELDYYTNITIGGEANLLFLRTSGNLYNRDNRTYFLYRLPMTYILENS